MTLPIVGTWTVEVHAARTFSIHGDLYYEIHVTRADGPPQTPMVLRVPQHAAPRVPREGEKLQVTFLMGQVTAAKPVE